VADVSRDRRSVTVATDRGPTVELTRPYLQAGNLRHAYALTGHAAQGLTVERAFVLGAGEARLQEWGYVALSRARVETRVYVTGERREHESHFHDLDDRDPLSRFGRALEESAAEELAVDQRPLPTGPRHDARPEIERPQLTDSEKMRVRLLDHRHRALTKTRDAAGQRLQTAQKSLARCDALRHKRREALRAQVTLQTRAVEKLDEQLAETAAAIEVAKRGRPDRERAKQRGSRSREARARGEISLTRER
jgi:hypothetical protein